MSVKHYGFIVLGVVLAAAAVVAFRPPAAAPAGSPPGAVAENLPLPARIDRLLREEAENLSADRHTPWELAHAALALGMDAPVVSRRDPTVRSLSDYFFVRPRFLGEMFYDTSDDGVRVIREVKNQRYESHAHEFLAIYALAGVPLDQPIALPDGRSGSVRGMLDTAKREYTPALLPSFLLIAALRYEGVGARWVDRGGTARSATDLVEEQLRYPPDSQPCGGSHGLLALALSADALRAAGPVPAPYAADLERRVRAVLDGQRSRCLEFQRADGSLSSAAFGLTGEELPRRVFVTGHTLEWVVPATGPDALASGPYCRMAEFLVECAAARGEQRGTLGEWFHALHALKKYRARTTPSGA